MLVTSTLLLVAFLYKSKLYSCIFGCGEVIKKTTSSSVSYTPLHHVEKTKRRAKLQSHSYDGTSVDDDTYKIAIITIRPLGPSAQIKAPFSRNQSSHGTL